MSRVIDYILNAIPYMLCAMPLIILIRIVYLSVAKAKKHGQKANWYHEVGLCLFFMFIVGVASQTIIPKLEFGNTASSIVNENLSGEINFIPGMVFADVYKECFINHYPLFFVINVLGNICLFIPVGFGLPLLWNRISFKKTLLVGLAASVFIELCQLPQARGTDIDDIWINTIGALLGYAIYSLLSKSSMINNLFSKFKSENQRI